MRHSGPYSPTILENDFRFVLRNFKWLKVTKHLIGSTQWFSPFEVALQYSDPKDRILDISLVLWETTLAISDSIETGSPVESEIVRY